MAVRLADSHAAISLQQQCVGALCWPNSAEKTVWYVINFIVPKGKFFLTALHLYNGRNSTTAIDLTNVFYHHSSTLTHKTVPGEATYLFMSCILVYFIQI